MAGDWVAMRVSLYRHPKVILMTDLLSTNREFMNWVSDPVQVTCSKTVGEHIPFRVTVCVTCHALSQVWGIANEIGKADGDDLLVSHLVISALDEIAAVPGIGEAMEAVGWAIHEERNGIDYVRFPDFMVYNIPSEKRAASKAAERKRRQRERERDMSRDAGVTKRDKSHGTVQDSTEHNTNTNTPLPPKGKRATRPTITAADCTFPPELDTPAARDAWGRWLTYKSDRGERYKSRDSATAQLDRFARAGPDRFVAAVAYSIAQNYAGIYEEKGLKHGTTVNPSTGREAKYDAPDAGKF